MRALSTRLHWRPLIIAAFAVLPALAVIAYEQAVDRRVTRERTLQEDLRFTHIAAAQQASVFTGAARMLDTLAQFPAVRSGEASECSRALTEVLRGHPGYVGIIVLDRQGTVFCGSDPAILAVQSSDRPWFQRAIQARRTVAGEYQVGRGIPRRDIVIAKPLIAPSGDVVRVIAAGIDLEQFDLMPPPRSWGPGQR